MSAKSEFLALTDVARLAEVQLSAVSNWRARHADFPNPVLVAGREVFQVREIARWLDTRTIPQNRLHSSEPPGTSYGTRLLSNLGILDSPITAEVPLADRSPSPSWSAQLFAAVSALREIQDPASSREVLLGLVFLKATQPDLWRSVTQASEGYELRDLLARASHTGNRELDQLPAFRWLAETTHPAIREAIRVVDSLDLDGGSNAQPAAGQISDAILEDLERGMGRSGGHFTPPDVARCLAELLDPQPSSSLYDPFCGSGELLRAAVEQVRRRSGWPVDRQVCGQTPADWSRATSAMNLRMHGIQADLRLGMAPEHDRFSGQLFDRILTNPPFNLRTALPPDGEWPFGQPPAHNANYAWLQHVLTKLAPAGRATVLMSTGAASSGGRELTIRKGMVEAGVVECLIALPSQLFMFTAIPTMIWVLRAASDNSAERSMLFIDAQHLGEMVDRTKRRLRASDIGQIADEYRRWQGCRPRREFVGASGFSRAASLDQIRANDYILAPARYTSAATERLDVARVAGDLSNLRREFDDLGRRAKEVGVMLDTNLVALVAGKQPDSVGQTVRLDSVCEVRSGPGTVTRGEEDGAVPLVLPRNIRDKQVGGDDLELISPAAVAKLARYRLEAGDIVTARAGTLGRFALVSESQVGWVLGPGCVRLRPHGQVSPAYLTNYLGSPSVQNWLMALAAGSAIPHVNAATFGALPIWLPSLESQQAIVNMLYPFDAAVSLHRSLHATAREIQDLVLASLMLPAGTDETD